MPRPSSSAIRRSIDLFFSRRIGLSATGVPIDILGGARLSGKLGGWNVGALNIQTDEAENAAGTQVVGQANNFTTCADAARGRAFELRRHLRQPARHRQLRAARRLQPRYGVDANIQLSSSQRVSAFLARTDSRRRLGRPGQRLRRARVLQLHEQPVADFRRLFAGGRDLQSRGRLPAAPRLSASRVPRVLPAAAQEHRVDSAHRAARFLQLVLRLRRRAADRGVAHPPARDPAEAGRPLRLVCRLRQGQSDGAVHGL